MTFCQRVAGVANLDGVDGRDPRHQRVQAADAKQAGHQLVGAGSVIGVPQDDLANRVADSVLPRIVETAKPDHVSRVIRLAGVARCRLPRRRRRRSPPAPSRAKPRWSGWRESVRNGWRAAAPRRSTGRRGASRLAKARGRRRRSGRCGGRKPRRQPKAVRSAKDSARWRR